MPKLSVYVPDELWARVKHDAAGSAKPKNSQLVQTALERMVSEREAQTAGLRAGAVLDEARLATVVERLRDQAHQEFEEGYEAGLELAEQVEFYDLRVVVNAGGLGEGLEYLYDLGTDDPGGGWAEKYGGAFADPNQVIDWSSPSEPFCAGAQQAIDDVWQALRANAWGTAPPDGGPAGGGDSNEGGESAE
jgi:predicted transcriptional regulator